MNKEYFTIPNLEIHEVMDGETGYMYFLFRNMQERFVTALKWDPMEMNDPAFWESISEKVKTLLFKRIKFEEKTYSNEQELLEFIERNYPKLTPNEKLRSVLEHIHGLTKFDGDAVDVEIANDIVRSEVWRKYYFANTEEFVFYIENLENQGLISYKRADDSFLNLTMTLAGLTAVIKIQEEKSSRYCFVAMSFDSSLVSIYNDAILPALKQTGFDPYIVSNEHIGSETTINDAIIAGIKKARFTIADFTQHKRGVYFEAGFALGRGQKVIYTCRYDEIAEAHFDTRNYQHIVWENPEDLKQKLIDKITAFVLE